MSNKIPRWKPREEWTAADVAAAQAARSRGEVARIENPAYVEARRVALDAAGLEPEDGAAKDRADMNIEDLVHARKMPDRFPS